MSDELAALLVASCVIALLLVVHYAIISEARADGIRAARGKNVTWKKLLKKPGALILALFFTVIVGVLLIPALGLPLFIVIWVVYGILKEYFKQKELKRIRTEKINEDF